MGRQGVRLRGNIHAGLEHFGDIAVSWTCMELQAVIWVGKLQLRYSSCYSFRPESQCRAAPRKPRRCSGACGVRRTNAPAFWRERRGFNTSPPHLWHPMVSASGTESKSGKFMDRLLHRSDKIAPATPLFVMPPFTKFSLTSAGTEIPDGVIMWFLSLSGHSRVWFINWTMPRQLIPLTWKSPKP